MSTQFKTRAELSGHPAFAGLARDTDGIPCVWQNTYECRNGHEVEVWTDEWSCCCDTECPTCGLACSPMSVWIGPEQQEALKLWEDLTDRPAADKDGTETKIEGTEMAAQKSEAEETVATMGEVMSWHAAIESVMAQTKGSDDNARLAARSLGAIYPSYDNDTAKTAVMDCLSDIRHLCDLMGWAFSDLDADAQKNYTIEVVEHGPANNEHLREAVLRDLC